MAETEHEGTDEVSSGDEDTRSSPTMILNPALRFERLSGKSEVIEHATRLQRFAATEALTLTPFSAAISADVNVQAATEALREESLAPDERRKSSPAKTEAA